MSEHENRSGSRYKSHIIYIFIIVIISGALYYFYDLSKKYLVIINEKTIEAAEQKRGLEELNNKYVNMVSQMEMSENDKLFLINNLNDVMQNYGIKVNEVNELSKAVHIDDELLKKYSKYYFLNENYTPSSTTLINPLYTLNTKEMYILTEIKSKLDNMIINASNEGVKIVIHSGYRSFAEQQKLKAIYIKTYGVSKSNQFSADQGYSEHQLGTTIDIDDGKSGIVLGFEKSTTFTWMQNNAHKYGFIMSYNKGNDYYEYEPWHYRYVGVELATYLHNNNLNFYDLDQKYIDSYKGKIFD